MGRVGLAFKILFSKATAEQVIDLLRNAPSGLPTAEAEPAAKAPAASKSEPRRSEAVTLLSALQREARFVDFLQEPIDAYSDAQVGAAVREVHRGCREVLTRIFAPAPILSSEEGSTVDVPDPAHGAYRLTGNVAQTSGAVSGKLVHHGWVASRCDLPKWSGDADSVEVIAAAEIEIS